VAHFEQIGGHQIGGTTGLAERLVVCAVRTSEVTATASVKIFFFMVLLLV
jgi:hypothetical protein